jgi:hypothetical protein
MSNKLLFLLGIMLILMLAITPSNIQAFCVTNDSIAGQAELSIINLEQAAINSHLLNSSEIIKVKANIANLTKDLCN